VDYVGRIEVTQNPQKTPLSELPQVYDSSLKNWITEQVPAILPLLLPGAHYEGALNVEIIHPPMRVDKVFKILYDGKEQILHLEFETGYDNQLKSRLLVYNASFYRDYRLPVITLVVYPFSTTMATSPLHIENILTFHFKTLPLFEQNAEELVRQHHTAMYPLLPTMQNVHANLIFQVMQEMAELYRHDQGTLSQQLIWMQLLLERTDTVPDLEKEKIEDMLNFFEELWETSPRVQRMREAMREQYHMQGLQEGRQEGELLALQRILVNTIRARYPDLAEFAQQQASHLNKPDALELLIQKVMTAPDASTTRWLLEADTGK
jgi:hypothetical protein